MDSTSTYLLLFYLIRKYYFCKSFPPPNGLAKCDAFWTVVTPCSSPTSSAFSATITNCSFWVSLNVFWLKICNWSCYIYNYNVYLPDSTYRAIKAIRSIMPQRSFKFIMLRVQLRISTNRSCQKYQFIYFEIDCMKVSLPIFPQVFHLVDTLV